MPDSPATPPAAVTVYWRPGCGFCSGLLRSLERHEVVFDRRNIWEDDAAAALVRRVADGNETVPTVVVGDVALVNPSADDVLTTLATMDPAAVPDDWSPREPGPFARTVDRFLGG